MHETPRGYRLKDEVPYAASRAFEIQINGAKAKMACGTTRVLIRRGSEGDEKAVDEDSG
jgi:hypothetical protein